MASTNLHSCQIMFHSLKKTTCSIKVWLTVTMYNGQYAVYAYGSFVCLQAFLCIRPYSLMLRMICLLPRKNLLDQWWLYQDSQTGMLWCCNFENSFFFKFCHFSYSRFSSLKCMLLVLFSFYFCSVFVCKKCPFYFCFVWRNW